MRLPTITSTIPPTKQMPYESGMDPFGDAHQRYDVKFYLIAILFLVFDVELLFLYPWAVLVRSLGWTGIGVMASFFVVLGAGYGYARSRGALEWR